MLQSRLRRARRTVANARTLVLIAVLAVVGGVLPVERAAAAGDGVLSVSVSILDGAGNPVSTVNPLTVGTYSVNIAYGCSVAACDGTTVFVAPTPVDPYNGTRRKETSFTVTPPAGVTPGVSGNLNTGITINLGTLAASTSTALRVNYRVDAGPVTAGASYFPTGSPIAPQVTLSSPTATGNATGTASATWETQLPNPTLSPSTPARTRTDTEITVSFGLSHSGCVYRINGVWAALATVMCAGSYSGTIELPANAEYVSGGSYDPGTHTVTISASGNTVPVGAGYGAGTVPVVVRFPSDLYPTDAPACVVNETFGFTYAITYLEGTVKTVTADNSVEVQNCAPFAKGSLAKVAYLSGAQYSTTVFPIPLTPGETRSAYWRVGANNQANVPGVATIVDETLDQPDLPVGSVRVARGGPATVTYTLDNGDSDTVTLNDGATYAAPTGRRIVSVTATSSELIGPNTYPNQTAVTPFTVDFFTTIPWDATPGTRTNTATATVAYPDHPALDPVELTAERTVTLESQTDITARAEAIQANLGSPPVTPVAGSELAWQVRGRYIGVAVDSPLRPQYIYLAPVGWTIVPDGASMVAPAPAGVTFTYRTVTFEGVEREAVVAEWPGPIGLTGDVTLPWMQVRTVPTTAAPAGTGNQVATLLVGDAGNAATTAYHPATYADITDVDGDVLTSDMFGRRETATNLAPTLGIGAVKQICRPDLSEADGCDWVSDSSVQVGVPPTATSIKYRVIIENRGNAALSNVVGYDVLPFIGDTGTTDTTAGTPRGSTVQEQLAAVSEVSPGLTLSYSTSTNPPRPEVYSGSTSGTFTGTVAGASAIRMAIGSLPAGASRSFVYEAALVGGAADQVACNSVAVTATSLTASEPPAVCATTREADFSITSDDRFPLQEGRLGVVPFVVNQGGGSQLASGTVTIDVPAGVALGDLSRNPAWRCTAPGIDGPVAVTCVPINPDTTTRQLALDTPETIELEVVPAPDGAGSSLCFGGRVVGLMHDPNLANNEITACSQVAEAAGLAVSKDDGVALLAPGDETTYTIEVANMLVGEALTGAVLTDTLPANTTFVSATPAPTTSAGGTLTWNLADLGPAGVAGPDGDDASGAADSTQTVTVTVAVSPTATGTVVNAVTVTAPDPVGGDDLTATDTDSDTVQSAALTLTKTASPTGVNAVGDDVTYTFVVTNTGNVSLSGIAIDDPLAGLSPIGCGGVTTLAAGADVECTATYEATAADFAAGQIVNTATVSGQPAVGPSAESPEATATVTAAAAPRLDLTKAATEDDFDAAGDVLDFTFTVANSGNVALSGLSVADQLPGTTPVVCVPTTVAPDESATCTATYAVTQADVDAGGVTNTATATATAANGAPTTSAPAQTFVPAVRNGAISLEKTATETSFTEAGTVLHYRFDVTNEGNVTLTDVAVSDPLTGTVTCPSPTLPVGQSMTCTATYTTTLTDVNDGGVTNAATVTANAPGGPVEPDTDSITVQAVAQPAIAIVKTVADTQLDSAGQILDYTFVVTNTGNVTLDDVNVADPFPYLSPVVCDATTLDPGESTTCAATYEVTQDDIDDADQLINSATAWGTPPSAPAVPSQPDSAPVPPVVLPALTVTKSSDTLSFDAAGTPITFDFVVTNTGNVTISGVAIADPLPGVGTASCDDDVLSPGEATNCSAAGYVTTQADVDNGGVVNTATAMGATPSGNPVVSAIAQLEIPADQTVTATLVKGGAANQGDVDTVGEQVTFTFDVHNTGNVTLTNIAVTDVLAGVSAVSCPTNVLIPDAQVRCTATYAVTQADLDNGVIHNEAEVTATGLGDPVPATFDLDVAQNGDVALAKTALTLSFDGPDQQLDYQFVVTNSGNISLTGVAVTDPLPGMSAIACPVTALAPGASTTCTGSYTTTQEDVDSGSVVNIATVSAVAAGGTNVSNESEVVTVDAVQTPDIELTKEADADNGRFDAAEQVITYTLTVVNTGNVTLTGVDVSEGLVGASAPDGCDAAELAPGGQTSCNVTYTTTQQDVDNGGFTNTAAVEASGAGTTVTDAASVPLTAVQAPGATFTKTADDSGFDAAGDILHYTLTVTNTGNVTFTGIAVTDTLPGVTIDCPTTVLAPQDGPLVCTATYKVSQHDVDAGIVTNHAHVAATAPGGVALELDATAVVIGTQTASIRLVKSAQEPSFAAAGQTLHYRFVVTNTGNVTLSAMTVKDPLPGMSAITCPVTELAPGTSTTCTGTYVTTQADVDDGRVVNTATATAVAPAANPVTLAVVTVSADSTVTVPAVQSPGVTLVKSAEETSFTAGTTIHYRFLITNIGNTTIQQLAVDDPLPGLSPVSCPVTSLAPGKSTTCTATYTATAADVTNGQIVNTATVAGVPVQGSQLVSEPSTVEVAAGVTPPPAPPPSTTPPPPSVPGELPATGNDSDRLLTTAVLVLAAGLVIVVAVRRRRARTT